MEEIVDRAEPIEIDVEDRDVGAEAQRDAGGVDADGAGTEHHHVTRRHPRHPGQQDAAAAVGLGQVEGALLDGEAAGHLAHRGQQRQAAVGAWTVS